MITVPAVPAFWGPLYTEQWSLSPTGRSFVSWLGSVHDEEADRLRSAILNHDSQQVLAADLPGWLEKWAAQGG